ncbi:CL17A protein, partial [Penelope pileata]|nr:CL17A protein [Penelope pileata]
IYSAAGKMTPMNDFRPASPDSFTDEDDYDDVSVSGSDRGPKLPPSKEDLQNQRSKGGTGVYILAGKPACPNPSPVDNPEPSRRRGHRQTSVAVLYALVALSFVAWVLLLALALVKQVEIMAELELLRSNYSENQVNMLQDSRREQARMRSTMRSYYKELQDIAVLICKALPNNKCLAGWKIFEESCYSFSTERMSWWDAKETCVDQGAHLVIINSDEEQ